MSGDNRANIDNIDPDLNHYNNNMVNFGQYSNESFLRDLHKDQNSLNLYHNNARSILTEGRWINMSACLTISIIHSTF